MSLLEVPQFAIGVRPERSRVVLSLSGELDLANAAELDAALSELRGLGWTDIALDLHAVTFIDSSGLAVLVRTAEAARREGWRLEVSETCPSLERLRKLTCLSPTLEAA